jgi:DNA-nicking Smr family endonuclease
MARRRTLRPDEEELWQTVARSTNPLHGPGFHTKPAATDPPAYFLPDRIPAEPPAIPLFSVGEKVRTSAAHRLAPSLRDSLIAAPLRMDAKAFVRMTRGKLSPEARIDLHGMTLAEAHPELIRFILNAQSAGLRLVLVITGKGKRGDDTGPIPQRTGALRHHVPQWLRLPPLGPAVLQVAEAHLKHGGSGAYYVYLRRG